MSTPLPSPLLPPDPALPRRRFEIRASGEAVLAVAALFWTLSANAMFFRAAMRYYAATGPTAWLYLAGLGIGLTALQFALLGLVCTRHTLKPLLALLAVATAVAGYFMQTYGVYLDPSMLRNVLHTHAGEAGELLNATLALHLIVYAGLPLAVLWRVRLVDRPWRRAAAIRLLAVAGALVVVVATVMAAFQPLASLMRNHKEVRYLITPSNLVYSSARVLRADASEASAAREPIGQDARPGPSWATRTRPRVVVLVIGETARAANWGLSGYARQTTPELARLPVINFAQVTSCGTNTEVSLPCMFAPVGRRDYDETRIRRQESLLHVAARAGVRVQWRDNQSGCKGVCEGLASESVSALNAPGLCSGEQCMDEGLLHDLDNRLARADGTQLWVLHQLGNHGPAYFQRYPKAFARFKPACESDELSRCSREEIVNAYDNALLYTDHLLATLIATLRAHQDRVDAAMLYVSDHGESLGESGLYLHGMPYAIAPEVQTRVPMVMWSSDGFLRSAGLGADCLRARAAQPASHDHLFHTVLGLLDVQTSVYERAWDLGAACRSQP